MTKTEDTMLDRVAKAIAREMIERNRVGISAEETEILVGREWTFHRGKARAALSAMRAPTEAMIEAEGRARYDDWDEWPASFKSDFRAGILIGWNAAITAALGETP